MIIIWIGHRQLLYQVDECLCVSLYFVWDPSVLEGWLCGNGRVVIDIVLRLALG